MKFLLAITYDFNHFWGERIMKQTVQMNNIQARMQPGVITLEGFLGSDNRNLLDILTEDQATVNSLKLTHQQIALKMLEFKEKGLAGLGEFISVTPHFEVRVDSVRGKIPCPFGDPGIFPKTNIIVKNQQSDQEITFTDLNIHMILVHGFYEGHGSLFRLEPNHLAAVLEISAAEDE